MESLQYGSDADMLVDPSKTTSMLKPVGKDSSLKILPMVMHGKLVVVQFGVSTVMTLN